MVLMGGTAALQLVLLCLRVGHRCNVCKNRVTGTPSVMILLRHVALLSLCCSCASPPSLGLLQVLRHSLGKGPGNTLTCSLGVLRLSLSAYLCKHQGLPAKALSHRAPVSDITGPRMVTDALGWPRIASNGLGMVPGWSWMAPDSRRQSRLRLGNSQVIGGPLGPPQMVLMGRTAALQLVLLCLRVGHRCNVCKDRVIGTLSVMMLLRYVALLSLCRACASPPSLGLLQVLRHSLGKGPGNTLTCSLGVLRLSLSAYLCKHQGLPAKALSHRASVPDVTGPQMVTDGLGWPRIASNGLGMAPDGPG